jgi:hypothetical protein
VALTRRSLPKLQHHLARMGIVLSEEALRQSLIDAGSALAHPLVKVEPRSRLR